MKNKVFILCAAAALVLSAWMLKKQENALANFQAKYLIINAPKQITTATTLQYTLDTSNVELTTAPSSPPYASSDYDNSSKPLIAEGHVQNEAFAADASTVHSSATGYNNVFFGGDSPSSPDSYGASCTSLYTRQRFNLSNFPISLEADFYQHSSSLLYNEFYFWMGSADPDYYNPATTGHPSGDAQEGFLLGGFVDRILLSDRRNSAMSTVFIKDSTHNLANYEQWFNYKITLDTANGNIVIRDIYINNTLVFNYDIVLTDLAAINWENDFRLAISVDDLAHDFKITYNDPTNTAIETVKEVSNAPHFNAFPNPARHLLQVSCSTPDAKVNKMQIIDALGRVAVFPTIEKNSDNYTIDVSALSVGTYQLVIHYGENQSQTIPFIKQP